MAMKKKKQVGLLLRKCSRETFTASFISSLWALFENKFYMNNNNWCATEQTYTQSPLTVTALKLKCAIFFNVKYFPGTVWKSNYKVSISMKSVNPLCYQNIALFVWASLHSYSGSQRCEFRDVLSDLIKRQTGQRSGNLWLYFWM